MSPEILNNGTRLFYVDLELPATESKIPLNVPSSLKTLGATPRKRLSLHS